MVSMMCVPRALLQRCCRSYSSSSGPSSFAALGLAPELCGALSRQGISTPSQIQELAIPALLLGGESGAGGAAAATAAPRLPPLLIAAETGSGKTVAYLAPLLQRLNATAAPIAEEASQPRAVGGPRLLVLAPNRNLCRQVQRVAAELVRQGGLSLSCGQQSGGARAARLLPSRGGRRGATAAAVATTARAQPEVLIASPRALLPPGITPPLGKLSTLVLDEGDLLLRDGAVLPTVKTAFSLGGGVGGGRVATTAMTGRAPLPAGLLQPAASSGAIQPCARAAVRCVHAVHRLRAGCGPAATPCEGRVRPVPAAGRSRGEPVARRRHGVEQASAALVSAEAARGDAAAGVRRAALAARPSDGESGADRREQRSARGTAPAAAGRFQAHGAYHGRSMPVQRAACSSRTSTSTSRKSSA
jgi:hypothetical protein